MLDAAYRRLYNDLKSFIPESRLATDPLRTLAYGTDSLQPYQVDPLAQVVEQAPVAWQRIEWPMHFIENWDHAKVQAAVDNFIWVAECEEAGEILPRR